MNTHHLAIVIVTLCLLAPVFYFGKRKIRRARKKGYYWSIGYQHSQDPLRWQPDTAKIYDKSQLPIDTKALADPFIIKHQDDIYLFCEVASNDTPQAKIGVSLYDKSREKWMFQSIVLDEPFHLSYPYVFADGSDFFMIPESRQVRSVRLYRSNGFPLKWKLEKILIDDKKYVDPSIVFWRNQYYLFVTRKRRLYLYYSDTLTGKWQPHPKSPVKRWNHARCAGRIFKHNGCLYRPAQEQATGYGNGVYVYKILNLSPTGYKEILIDNNPVLKPFGDGWAAKGMHHIDILRMDKNDYFAVFDGRGIIRQ